MNTAFLKRRAKIYCQRAERTRDPSTRHDLLTLAARFEELANADDRENSYRGLRVVSLDERGTIRIEHGLFAATIAFVIVGVVTSVLALLAQVDPLANAP